MSLITNSKYLQVICVLMFYMYSVCVIINADPDDDYYYDDYYYDIVVEPCFTTVSPV